MTASNRGASDELSGLIEIDIDLELDNDAPASDADASVAGPEIDIEIDLDAADMAEADNISDDEILDVEDLVEAEHDGVRPVADDALESVPDDQAYDLFELVDSSVAPPPLPPPLPAEASMDSAMDVEHPVLDLVDAAGAEPADVPAHEPAADAALDPIASINSPPASTDDAPAVLGRLDLGKARRQFVKELQRKNEELESQVLALQAETLVSHDRVEKQSRKMDEVQNRLMATEGQLAIIGAGEGSDQVLAELARMRAEMEESARAAEARVADLEVRLEVATEREAAASIQAASFAEEAEVFNAREAEYTARIKGLEAQLAETRVSLASLQGATDAEKELAKQNESLRFRMATLEAAVGLAEAKAQDTRGAAVDLERELEVARELSSRAEQDVKDAQTKAAELQTRVDTLTVDIAALTARTEVAEDAREEAEADLAVLSAERDQAAARVAELESHTEEQAQALASAFANAQEAVETAETEKHRADAAALEVTSLTAAKMAAESQAGELEATVSAFQQSLDRAREELSDLEAERTTLERKLKAAVEQQDIVAATVAEARARVAEAEGAREAAAARTQEVSDEIAGMRSELKAARVQAQGAEALADKVNALKGELEAEVQKAEERDAALQALEAAAQTASSEHQQALDAAKAQHATELEAAHAAADEVRAELDAAASKLEAVQSEALTLIEARDAGKAAAEEAHTALEAANAALVQAQSERDELAAARDEQPSPSAVADLEATRDEALALAEALGAQVDELTAQLQAAQAQAARVEELEAQLAEPGAGFASPELESAVARVEELEAALASVRSDVPSIDLELDLDAASEVGDLDLEPGELEAITSQDEDVQGLANRVAQLESELSLARDALAAMPPSMPTQDVDEATLEELAVALEESRQLKARVRELETTAPDDDDKVAAQVEALREEYADLAEAFEDLQQSHFERGKQLMNSLAEGERMRANLVRIAQELSAVREEADTLSRHAEDLESEKRHNTGVIEQLHEQLAAVVDDANAVAAVPPLGSPSRPLSPQGSNRRPVASGPVSSGGHRGSASLFGIADDDLAFENSQSRIPEFRGGATQFGAPSVDEEVAEPESNRWLSSGEGSSTQMGQNPEPDDDDFFGGEHAELPDDFEFDSGPGDGVDPLAALESMGVLDLSPTADLAAARGLDHRAGFLLSMVDGHTTVRDLIDISGMPVDEVCTLIKDLFDAGALDA